MPLHSKLDYAHCIGREISNASRNWAESQLDYHDQCTHHHLCKSKSQCSNIRSLSFQELKRKNADIMVEEGGGESGERGTGGGLGPPTAL